MTTALILTGEAGGAAARERDAGGGAGGDAGVL